MHPITEVIISNCIKKSSTKINLSTQVEDNYTQVPSPTCIKELKLGKKTDEKICNYLDRKGQFLNQNCSHNLQKINIRKERFLPCNRNTVELLWPIYCENNDSDWGHFVDPDRDYNEKTTEYPRAEVYK